MQFNDPHQGFPIDKMCLHGLFQTIEAFKTSPSNVLANIQTGLLI